MKKEQFINWDVPKNWVTKHKTEIARTTRVAVSLVGLLTLVGIAYQAGVLNGQRNTENNGVLATPTTLERDQELMEASALVTTINENSSACGDALVMEWRQGGMEAADGSDYQHLIIFGDYPSAYITDSRIVIKSGDQPVASEFISFAGEFGVWFISDKSPDGSHVPVPECLKDSYTSGWYERDVNGDLRQVTEEEMLCMTLVEGMLTHENHVEVENKCEPYWEK